MHPCLLIAELFENIVRRVIAGDDVASVASLAITCQAFKEISLNAIWRDQANLVPLIKCMPADLWTENLVSRVPTLVSYFTHCQI